LLLIARSTIKNRLEQYEEFSVSTKELFRDDGYLKTCSATVTATSEDGFCVDQTVFYPLGGGQPGDQGIARCADGREITICDTRKSVEDNAHYHLVEVDCKLPEPGEQITLEVNWVRRHRFMRMHSCMHMLCAIVPAGVTGGSISEDRARLDFDMQETLDKQHLTTELNRLIEENHPMSMRWITDDEMDQQPDLVRTMSVQPPRSSGRVRLVNFEGIDLQPCGGTHVASSGEIGRVRVQKIEKKGKHNRRVIVVFDDQE
jgi:misacylated tRNA(Ala) deacylase